VGVERQGLRFSLSHIGEDEWRWAERDLTRRLSEQTLRRIERLAGHPI